MVWVFVRLLRLLQRVRLPAELVDWHIRLYCYFSIPSLLLDGEGRGQPRLWRGLGPWKAPNAVMAEQYFFLLLILGL